MPGVTVLSDLVLFSFCRLLRNSSGGLSLKLTALASIGDAPREFLSVKFWYDVLVAFNIEEQVTYHY